MRLLPLIVLLSTGSCAVALPTPVGPQGRGWATTSQGFHDWEVSFTRIANTVGNKTTTTTISKHSSRLTNVRVHEKLDPDSIQLELVRGNAVPRLNEKIRRDYQL